MEERSQGAIEYLLMLSAVLIILAGVVYSLTSTSYGFGEDIQTRIDSVRDNVINILT